MIFDILKDGLDYVGTNRNQIILYYLGILLFPLVLIESYSYHIIENCLNGMINNKDELPDFTVNSKSFIKGLKLLVLKIIYFLPEIIIFIFLINIKSLDFYITTLLIIILTVVSYYISQIASICMVESDSFREGFNLSKITDTLKSVGLTYIELIIATFVIILGIIGVTIVVAGFLIFLSNISTVLFTILSLLIIIAYIALLIVIIPIYVLFKYRTIVSTYNLN